MKPVKEHHRKLVQFSLAHLGTGKTTVARRVGALFKSLDLLSSPDVVEHSASDFGTGFAGQSAEETRKIFASALGKTLFVDEAYRCGVHMMHRPGAESSQVMSQNA